MIYMINVMSSEQTSGGFNHVHPVNPVRKEFDVRRANGLSLDPA